MKERKILKPKAKWFLQWAASCSSLYFVLSCLSSSIPPLAKAFIKIYLFFHHLLKLLSKLKGIFLIYLLQQIFSHPQRRGDHPNF